MAPLGAHLVQTSSPHVSQYSNKHADETFTSQLPWEGENDGCSVCDQKLYRWGGDRRKPPPTPPNNNNNNKNNFSFPPRSLEILIRGGGIVSPQSFGEVELPFLLLLVVVVVVCCCWGRGRKLEDERLQFADHVTCTQFLINGTTCMYGMLFARKLVRIHKLQKTLCGSMLQILMNGEGSLCTVDYSCVCFMHESANWYKETCSQ